jgi:tRNA A-37 threonylcarbamoyl transferase component Bud32
MNVRELTSFCWADREFFDAPERIDDSANRYPQPIELDARDWERSESGPWVNLTSTRYELPEQGWKIHVSSTLEDAGEILDIVFRYCAERVTGFKYLRSEQQLIMANEKNSPRESSGKFITIYPRDDDDFATILRELEPRLSGYAGPYILSDLRYRTGPLYVRYGAFRRLWCTGTDGEPVLARRGTDGELVPDVRPPFFTVPDGVGLPDLLAPDLAERRRPIDEDFPYRIQSAIRFANGGGIYRAVDERTGTPVVIREARPYAGWAPDGTDAVARLRRQKWALRRLSTLDCVPRLLDYRVVRTHHYLVEEYIDAPTLLDEVLTRCQLVDPDVPAAQRIAYTAWADEVLANLGRALHALHRRGLTFGDLHPSNVLVRTDNTVVLVDFEFAADATDNRRPVMAGTGFKPPAPLAGRAADHYALERVRLMALLPLTGVLERDRAKARTLIGVAAAELPVSPSTLGHLHRTLTPDDGSAGLDRAADLFAAGRYRDIQDAIVAGIHASATPDRVDRLFPGDPRLFTTGGIDLEAGAAGVLYALARSGYPVPDEYLDWLTERCLVLPRPTAGLYTGLPGAAIVLDQLGRPGAARAVLDRVPDEPAPAYLRTGRAGRLLAYIHCGQLARAEVLADRLDQAPTAGRPGLLDGWSGVALAYLRLYESTVDDRYLKTAMILLHRDLAACVTRTPGTLYVLDGSRNVPHLDTGSLGVAVALARYLRHRPEPAFAAAVAAVRRSCDVPFTVLSSLSEGRAGLILGLAEIGDQADDTAIRGHLDRLAWHAVNHRGAIAFPGAHLMRLSMDLFTGSAGVLLAVHAATERDGSFLPLLGAREARTAPVA